MLQAGVVALAFPYSPTCLPAYLPRAAQRPAQNRTTPEK